MNKKTPYDGSYKQLFSHPKMVRDLLLGFFREDWVKDLDFASLERVNSTYITQNLRERESDIVWKMRFNDQWLYVYLLLEFQSSIDQFMAVRLLTYMGLLYLDIIKQGRNSIKNNKLPPILPLVIYNGTKKWNAPLNFHELLDERIPSKLKTYQPNLHYWLLEERRYNIGKEADNTNTVAPLIALEQSTGPKEAAKIVEHLIELLKQPEDDSLRQAYITYLNRVVKSKKNST